MIGAAVLSVSSPGALITMLLATIALTYFPEVCCSHCLITMDTLFIIHGMSVFKELDDLSDLPPEMVDI